MQWADGLLKSDQIVEARHKAGMTGSGWSAQT